MQLSAVITSLDISHHGFFSFSPPSLNSTVFRWGPVKECQVAHSERETMDTHLGYSEWTPTRAMPASSLPGTAPESRFPPAHGVFIEPGIDNVDTGFRSCVWFQPRTMVRSAGSHRRHGRSMVGWLVWEREGQSFSTGCRHWDRQGRNPGEHVLSIRWRFGYKYYANRVRVEFCFNFPRS